ncbi:MAG: allantoinase PuuE [Hyphomicrobiaceae bacterium]
MRYPRDLHGYGETTPDPRWPRDSRIAVQFVVNFEEGGENNILHGDTGSEAFLSEIVGASVWEGERHWNMESIYEYGARAGFWRLHRLFTSHNIPVTVYGVATALARAPAQVAAMQAAEWEIASHGLKWIEYRHFERDDERQHLADAIRLHREVTGDEPKGWYTGRSSVNTVDIIAENGGFAYAADSYADDLPYWHVSDHKPLLIIPYTLDANDMRFATAQGFNAGDQFLNYLKDSFDTLYQEGVEGQAKMMSIGLHCRLVGRPGRIGALKQFIEYVQSHDKVWFATRQAIADHWHAHFPAPDRAVLVPSCLEKADFVERYGGIFEHSRWVAERAFDLELGPAHDTVDGLHNALCRAFRAGSDKERLEVLRAHPDLAGKLAEAERLTEASMSEQASAGLNALTDDERARFQDLNDRYVRQFEFPFIIAVRGLSKAVILQAFERRIANSRDDEFSEACRQVERIALLRLRELLPQSTQPGGKDD